IGVELPGLRHPAAGSDVGQHAAECAEGHVHRAMEGDLSRGVDFPDHPGLQLFRRWLARCTRPTPEDVSTSWSGDFGRENRLSPYSGYLPNDLSDYQMFNVCG